jgi:hypothetical protein
MIMAEKVARYEIDFLTEYTDEALLDELRRIAALLPVGQSLTKTAYERHSAKVAHSTIRRRFGGWKEALECAGLGHYYGGQLVSPKMREQPIKRLSNEDLLAELRRVHASVGKAFLTVSDFNANSITSAEAIRRRFGSWPEGLRQAGIAQSELANKGWTDVNYFENLAAVWTKFGRTPRRHEMAVYPSTISGKAYDYRFGTWRKALRAFVAWADSEDQTSIEPIEVPTQGSKAPTPDRAVRKPEDCREVRPALRFKVFLRDRFRCVACGRSPATALNIELHADHIRPVAHGGKTILDNLQTMCKQCNLGKGPTLVS